MKLSLHLPTLGTLCCALLAPAAQAQVFALPQASFAPPQVTFETLASGTPFSGLVTNGFTFTESNPGTAPDITTIISATSGPGDSNNVSGLVALSQGNPAGRLVNVTLPGLSLAFGFGYAALDNPLPNATTVTLFNGAVAVGSLSFASDLDPQFPGGFAGIGSNLPFNRATLSFPQSTAAYALDNFRVTAVPEPSAMLLLAAGIAGLLLLRARQQAS